MREAGVDWIGLNFHPELAAFCASRIGLPRSLAHCRLRFPPWACLSTGRPRKSPNSRTGSGWKSSSYTARSHRKTCSSSIIFDHSGVSLGPAFGLDERDGLSRPRRAVGRLPDAILIDAYVAGTLGGTGATIADDVLDHVPPLPRLILAGGLNAQNVGERVARVRPWMVDVASGVESAPGRKDLARIVAFIAAARRASESRNHEMVDKPHRDL